MTPTLSLGHSGISFDGTWDRHGGSISFQVIEDRETGRSRGFGFVTFGDKRSMDDAIAGKSNAVHNQSKSIQHRNAVFAISLYVSPYYHEAMFVC